MTLKQRTIAAFEAVGVRWPADTGAAVPIGAAVIQCEADNSTGLVCIVTTDTTMAIRNAKLMVLLCIAAGFPEPASDRWVSRELIAAKGKAHRAVKLVEKLRFDLTVDHPPTLIVLRVEERV